MELRLRSAESVSSLPLNFISQSIFCRLEYPVQLDTGSSDLFIKGESYPIPNTTETVSIVYFLYI